MKRILTLASAAILALLASTALAAPALGAFGFKDLDVTFTNEDGSITTEAGSHPFAMTTSFAVNTFIDDQGKEISEGETQDLTLGQIEGLAGNPTATPRCPTATFITLKSGTAASTCPNTTAVGIAAVRAGFTPPDPSETGFLHVPVFNLVPPPGVAAKLGFIVLREPVTVEITVNPEHPNNIVAQLENIPQILLFYASKFTLWGNPADHAHDAIRGSCLDEDNLLFPTTEPVSAGLCPVDIPAKPFLTLPRACLGPLTTTLAATAWNGVPPATNSALTHDDAIPPNPQGMSGCGALPFAPEIETQATTSQAESASGLDFSIDVKDQGLT